MTPPLLPAATPAGAAAAAAGAAAAAAAAVTGRAPAAMLRHLASGRPLRRPSQLVLQRQHQRRWAQVHDVRFLATTQAPLHILEKYRDKLDRKAREEGHADIEGLKRAYADRILEQRRRDAAAAPPGLDRLLREEQQQQQRQQVQVPGAGSPPPPPPQATTTTAAAATPLTTAPPRSKPSNGNTTSQVKPLSSILDLDKASRLPVPELTAVWRLRHAAVPNSLCAVVPASTYGAMEGLARRRPQFVLPVPHAGRGAELHFLQWTFEPGTGTSTVLFTQLAEYKARGEFARPHTTVTHYTDLAAGAGGEPEGVVLMAGQVVEDSGVRVADAQWLVMCLQRFYGGSAGEGSGSGVEGAAGWVDERAAERRRLLEWFGSGDERFSVEKLLEETERLG